MGGWLQTSGSIPMGACKIVVLAPWSAWEANRGTISMAQCLGGGKVHVCLWQHVNWVCVAVSDSVAVELCQKRYDSGFHLGL